MRPRLKRILFLCAIFFTFYLIGSTAEPARFQSRLHPSVHQYILTHPDEIIRVIIQWERNPGHVTQLVESLGGKITKDLHIINALAVEIPVGAIESLACQESIRWVTLDAPVTSTGKPDKDPDPPEVPLPENFFLDSLGVRQVWEMGFQGDGIGVAVIDSGIFTDRDFTVKPGRPHTRIKKQISFNSESPSDEYGHGTHIAGIIGGHGGASDGLYSGVAPKVSLFNLKIMGDDGLSTESDTVEAMQWVLENKDAYNIRVVNLSIQSTLEQSYHTSEVDAAAEILWFNGVVVVAASGNTGKVDVDPILTAPANDPFIITVGAVDEKNNPYRANDRVTSFSASGMTPEGFPKPELLAPGQDIISVLSSSSDWRFDHPDRVILDGEYIRLSGTSMSAPMVTGAVALLLESEPDLTPDQIKYRLMQTGSLLAGNAYLDVYAALTTPTTGSANTGIQASQLLWSGEDPVQWDSVNWGSVNWGSVNWGSVNWGSVNWGSVNWGSVNWGK
jgi:serine protease AprX